MSDTKPTVCAVQQTRRRAMVVPREHGAWGLLLVPLFTGMAAGFAPGHRVWPLLLFTVAALSLFGLRTPVGSLLKHRCDFGTYNRRTLVGFYWVSFVRTGGDRVSECAHVERALSSVADIRGSKCWCACNAGCSQKPGRGARMISQIVGAIGLTCTAPAAYYIGTGHLDTRAFVIWIANWMFAGNQIHFVQLRIHAARVATFAEKFARGQFFLVGQPILLLVLVWASLWHILPPLSILAFLPVVVRGSRWFFQKPEPLNVKSLGWSEMKQDLAFGFLLAVAFL